MVKSSDLFFIDKEDGFDNQNFKKDKNIIFISSELNTPFNKILIDPFCIQSKSDVKPENILQENIIELSILLGFDDKKIKEILQYTVSEFNKKGLCNDYYGYHNVLHELESAYFTLLICYNIFHNKTDKFDLNKQDIVYLFVAALLHDYDPLKKFDKPDEDSIEKSIRNDKKILTFIDVVGLNVNIVMALIHRTAYPFKGKLASTSTNRINELLFKSGINLNDAQLRKKYHDLGWFLSVAERVAGYTFGDFEHSKDIARRNAHALGWHPSVINKNSVIYFNSLKKEDKKMFEIIMLNLPQNFKNNFYKNVNSFKNAWNKEVELKSINKGKMKLYLSIESKTTLLNPNIKNTLCEIHKKGSSLTKINNDDFWRSLYDDKNILITLRLNEISGKIIGFAKGGPLENYELRDGTIDLNYGLHNTIYLEGLYVSEGYNRERGGHMLRIKFIIESQRRGYKFVTGYTHRDVILKRILNNENIAVVQRYDPDKLDYYRTDINNIIYHQWDSTNIDSF